MLIRIVKMSFGEEHAEDFMRVFEERKHLIASYNGCAGVELLRDIENRGVFFTYSKWKDRDSLEHYRQSELFGSTWEIVKKYFNDKPEAWSMEQL